VSRTSVFRQSGTAQETAVRDLADNYRPGRIIYDPDFALYEDAEFYQKIRRDTVTSHALQQRFHIVAGRKWSLEPHDEANNADVVAAHLLEKILERLPNFGTARLQLAKAILSGASYLAICGDWEWCRLPGDTQVRFWWVPGGLKSVGKSRFRMRVDDDGTPQWELFSIQRRAWETLENPEHYIRHVYDDDEESMGFGRGLSEPLYLSLYAKQIVMNEGLAGLERWAQGIVRVGVKRGMAAGSTGKKNSDLVSAWLDKIETLRSRHYIVSDIEDAIEVHETSGTGWQMVTEMLAYLDTCIRTLILGANLPTSATQGGSYALAEIQENSTEALVQYDRAVMAESLQQLIWLIFRLNRANLLEMGLAGAYPPRFCIKQERREDFAANADSALKLMDRVPLKAEELYERTGWSKPSPEDETVGGEPLDTGAGNPLAGLFNAGEGAEWTISRTTPGQDAAA